VPAFRRLEYGAREPFEPGDEGIVAERPADALGLPQPLEQLGLRPLFEQVG
jgi:hypothetical protein